MLPRAIVPYFCRFGQAVPSASRQCAAFGRLRCALPAAHKRRCLSSQSADGGNNDNRIKEDATANTSKPTDSHESPPAAQRSKPTPKEVVGEEMMDAIVQVAKELHGENKDQQKKTTVDLLSVLMSHEKESYKTATEGAMSELAADEGIASLVSGMIIARKDTGTRRDRRRRPSVQPTYDRFQAPGEDLERVEEISAMASEIFVSEGLDTRPPDRRGAKRPSTTVTIEPSASFTDDMFKWTPLGKFDKLRSSQPSIPPTLPLWSRLESGAVKTLNQGMGPRNAFEETIEWTEKGKLWPYPINNEYMLGQELEVGFHEHVFLERHLQRLNFPKTGPIRHFMELVCNGLSKNPYMTASKKVDHIEWFATYFDQQRIASVTRLHEREQRDIDQPVR